MLQTKPSDNEQHIQWDGRDCVVMAPEDYDAFTLQLVALKTALASIKSMTDVDNPESYRCDDREGCLDTVFATATRALEYAP